jgi:hypothetical protein
MTAVLTLTGYTPPARFDDLAWTVARLEETTSEAGSYTLAHTFTLDPVDSDPANPQTRDFTYEDATVGDWYRIVWQDADGDQSTPEPPVEFTGPTVAAYATAAELARLLKIDATTYSAQLAEVLLAAAGEIVSEIGRTDLAGWEQALAAQVNLERAEEHWKQRQLSFGIIGLDTEAPIRLGRDTWERHAHKLAPLKQSWGIA